MPSIPPLKYIVSRCVDDSRYFAIYIEYHLYEVERDTNEMYLRNKCKSMNEQQAAKQQR